MKNEPIIFFDGVCGLCNGFVDFVIKIDKDRVLKFAPLQGETAEKLLQKHYIEDLNTIVFLHNDQLLTKSDAVLEILNLVGGPWKAGAAFKFFPRLFRDYFYEVVSKNRYYLFGKKETCRLPSPEERKLFLN